MRKEDILEKTSILFKQYGVRSVSMDHIAHELSISKKTLYKYFPSKEDLLSEVVETAIENLQIRSTEIAKQDKHPLIRCVLITHGILEEFSDYNSSYHYTINRFSTKISSSIDDIRDTFTNDYFAPLLEEAKDLNCFHQKTNLELFLEMYFRYVDRNYFNLRPKFSSLSKHEILLHLIVFPLLGVCNETSRLIITKEIDHKLR